MEHPRRREGVKYISIALVLVAAMLSATVLTIYGYGEGVVSFMMISVFTIIFFGTGL